MATGSAVPCVLSGSRGQRGRASGGLATGFGPVLGVLAVAVLLLPAAPASGRTSASFLYPLASFAGPVPAHWAKLAVDPEQNEVYALRSRENDVRIFDDHGMEIYGFEGFPSATDIEAGDDGDILVLTHRYGESTIHRCNYRGEKLSEITLKNLPEEFSDFGPDRLVYRSGSFFLVDSGRMTVIVAGADGSFIRGHDLRSAVKRVSNANEDERTARRIRESTITGFDVDSDGNLLFTVATLFAAYRLSPDGELQGFGRAGSGKGKFGVASGLAVAPTGHVLVTDRLRCVVLIFGRDLTFENEFGYRGGGPSHLIAPDDVAIGANGIVYVSQAANRGISVFRMLDE